MVATKVLQNRVVFCLFCCSRTLPSLIGAVRTPNRIDLWNENVQDRQCIVSSLFDIETTTHASCHVFHVTDVGLS
jgi:hypothetical protein